MIIDSANRNSCKNCQKTNLKYNNKFYFFYVELYYQSLLLSYNDVTYYKNFLIYNKLIKYNVNVILILQQT